MKKIICLFIIITIITVTNTIVFASNGEFEYITVTLDSIYYDNTGEDINNITINGYSWCTNGNFNTTIWNSENTNLIKGNSMSVSEKPITKEYFNRNNLIIGVSIKIIDNTNLNPSNFESTTIEIPYKDLQIKSIPERSNFGYIPLKISFDKTITLNKNNHILKFKFNINYKTESPY